MMENGIAESDIKCVTCHDGESVAPNEIVICDVCNKGYHQRCHKPRIKASELESDDPWSCRQCEFALGSGLPVGKRRKLSKTKFPYNLASLVWDDYHTKNQQDSYCYCG